MEVAATEQPDKPRRGDGRPFPKGFSGNPKSRKAIRERAAELFGVMAADFAPLSAVDTVLLNQACLLLARSERVHRVRDIDVGLRMASEARRTIATLRRPAPKRENEGNLLADYLASKYGQPEDEQATEAAGEAVDASSENAGREDSDQQ